jgi:hypothetical protein
VRLPFRHTGNRAESNLFEAFVSWAGSTKLTRLLSQMRWTGASNRFGFGRAGERGRATGPKVGFLNGQFKEAKMFIAGFIKPKANESLKKGGSKHG